MPKKIPITEKHPEIAQEWHPDLNDLTAAEVGVGFKTWAWWRCLRNPEHQWKQPIYKRIAGLGCPTCQIQDKSMEKLFPDVAKDWHCKLNGELTANDVAAHSGQLAWWQCALDINHVWKSSVNNRTGSRTSGCPYCAGKQVDNSNSVAACRPDLAKEWHEKNSRPFCAGRRKL